MSTADYAGRDIMTVAFVAPIYMNPKQKKEDEYKRRKKRKATYKKQEDEAGKKDMPAESTVSFYV